jgi:FMN-dependent NADH-azoreductase
MSHVLVIYSSVLGSYSQSKKLLDDFSMGWKKTHPADSIFSRNLVSEPLPVLDGEAIGALGHQTDLTENQKAISDLSLTLINEIKLADYLVIAVPMYNFGVPVQLKMWMDLICRAGVSFSYTESGPVGLLAGKKVLIVTTTGGSHRNTATDLALAHTQTVLGFVGLSDITVAYAQSLAMGAEAQAAGLAEASTVISEFIASH